MSQQPASGPLVGIRVLDFGSYIAGPYGAAVLGDLGADVIKVESIGGDLARHWGPFMNGESRLFQGYNRNKRSIAVDLRSAAGREIAHALARSLLPGRLFALGGAVQGRLRRVPDEAPSLRRRHNRRPRASCSTTPSSGSSSRHMRGRFVK